MTPVVVIPMAGEGKRFAERGYTFPKYLSTIRGKPMIQWVIESLKLPDADYLCVCRTEHNKQYHVEQMLQQLVRRVRVLTLDAPTDGAARTVQVALEHVKNTQSLAHHDLLIVNSDQWFQWNPEDFFAKIHAVYADGGILVFPSVHPKWSFAKLDSAQEWVEEVAEKRPISPWATCGVYWWRKAQDFEDAAGEMFLKEQKVGGEYYVAPVYNYAIRSGAKVLAYPIAEMYGLGTPEDLEEFKMAVCVGKVE